MVDFLSLAKRESSKRTFCVEPYYNSTFFRLPELNALELNIVKLLMVNSANTLSSLLETRFNVLQELINKPEYISFHIPKKKGGVRQIFAPKGELKVIQKKLNCYLQAYYLYAKPAEVHGFVISPKYILNPCTIVSNARCHTNKKQVLNIDLKDFFPCITTFQVKKMFMSPPFAFSEHIATALALLTTYEGKLPIGAPTSSVISNFVCKQIDLDLKDFARLNNLTYTRYADDLTFSSITRIENACINGIREVIEQNKFQVNEKKFRLQTTNRKQSVTGLTVNEKVNVDRKLLKKIRAMLYDWSKNGLLKAALGHFKNEISNLDTDKIQSRFVNILDGYINFVSQVRGKNDPLVVRFKTAYCENMKCSAGAIL